MGIKNERGDFVVAIKNEFGPIIAMVPGATNKREILDGGWGPPKIYRSGGIYGR